MGRPKKKTTKKQEISLEQTYVTFMVKFYDEQILGLSDIYREQGFTRESFLALDEKNLIRLSIIKQATDEFFKRVKELDNKYKAFAIKHNRDTVTDGVWAIAKDKPHFHLIVRMRDTKKRVRISTVFNILGIKFEEGLDDNLLKNRAIEVPKHFENAVLYLTHDTDQARQDNKYVYSVTEDLVMNVGLKEYETIVSLGNPRMKMTDANADSWVRNHFDAFYEHGFNMGSWRDIYNTIPLDVKRRTRDMSLLYEEYLYGQEKGIEQYNDRPYPKTNIFILGEGNAGKSFASEVVLSKRGRTHIVRGGKTGKFDNMSPDKKSVLIDDNTVPDPLNFFDMKPTPTYRRNKNNAVCMADYMVVTSNIPFEPWLVKCKIEPEKDLDNYNNLKSKAGYYRNAEGRLIASLIPNVEQSRAMRTRFSLVDVKLTALDATCTAYYYKYTVKAYMSRGNEEMIEEIKNNVDAFVKDLNEVSKQRLFDSKGNLLKQTSPLKIGVGETAKK